MSQQSEERPASGTAIADPPAPAATAEPLATPELPATPEPTTTPEPTAPTTSIAETGDDPDRKMTTVTYLMHQGNDETEALLKAVGLRGELSGEARDIARLIERRLAVLAADKHEHPHAPAVDHLEIQRAFLEHRFVGPLRAYERTFRGYSVLDNFLNLTSILAGLGASLAAALEWPKVWPIVLGLVVGGLQSLSQWLKPSRRSTRRGLAANELRSEGWAFLQGRDRYKGKEDDPAGAWKLFCDQIDRVEEREQTEQDRESAEAGGAKSGGKRR